MNYMTNELVYSTRLTGAGFLLYELKQTLKLKNKGYNTEEIKEKIIDENVFQYKSIGTINRALPSIIDRMDIFDDKLYHLFLHSTVEESKVINLYAIMKTELLFFEFMNEVIRERIIDNNLLLENKDINVFFTEKSEQSEFIANLSDATVKRLKSAYMKVIYDGGLLRSRRGQEIMPLFIEEEFKRHLIHIGDRKYLLAMGDDGDL